MAQKDRIQSPLTDITAGNGIKLPTAIIGITSIESRAKCRIKSIAIIHHH
jgi:hypothetical protein